MTRRIASASVRSSIARSAGITSPHKRSARRSSQPSCPPAPMRRILGGIAHVSWQSVPRNLCEQRVVAVPVRKLGVLVAPRNRQIGITPQHAAFVLGMIELVALVDDFGDR